MIRRQCRCRTKRRRRKLLHDIGKA